MAKEFPKELRDILIKHLRRLGYRNIYYKETMASAHRGYGEWACSGCGEIVKRQELHADHIEPVVSPEKGFTTWDDYIERLFLGKLQPLCKSKCHAAKTKSENEIRRKTKHESKQESTARETPAPSTKRRKNRDPEDGGDGWKEV